MSKLISIVTTFAVMLCLASCGGNPKSENNTFPIMEQRSDLSQNLLTILAFRQMSGVKRFTIKA